MFKGWNLQYLYYSTINNTLKKEDRFFVKVNDGGGGCHVKKLNSFSVLVPGRMGEGGGGLSDPRKRCTVPKVN